MITPCLSVFSYVSLLCQIQEFVQVADAVGDKEVYKWEDSVNKALIKFIDAKDSSSKNTSVSEGLPTENDVVAALLRLPAHLLSNVLTHVVSNRFLNSTQSSQRCLQYSILT